jgi:uncharacterized protein YjiS (DUF1127 family)
METSLSLLLGPRRRARSTWRGDLARVRRPGPSATARIFAMIRLWRRRSYERQLLSRLNENERHDLALSVSDVMTEAAKPFWRG